RVACMCTVSRTGLPAYIRSAVTKCERCVSYAAITPGTLTSSFPNRLIQRVGEAAKMPFPIHPHMLRHACGFKLPGSAALPRAQEHPAHGQIRRNGARPVQGLLERLTLDLGHLGAAASGRRQARDDFRFPFDHLGIRGCLALRQYLLDDLDRALNLIVGHCFDAAYEFSIFARPPPRGLSLTP